MPPTRAASSILALVLLASPCRATELVASFGLGGPTRRFQDHDSKADLGPNLGLAVGTRFTPLIGLQAGAQVAFLDGDGDHQLEQTGDNGVWELSARQVTLAAGPTFRWQRARLELLLHLCAGFFVSDGVDGTRFSDAPGWTGDLHLSGPAAGAEGAVLWRASPSVSVGLVTGYTYRWAQQRDWQDRRIYDRGFLAASFALRWSSEPGL